MSVPDGSGNGDRRVALALGGGGARGFAHVGALSALEEEGFVPDLVVGTSMGAIVGSAWCAGTPASELRAIVSTIDTKRVADWYDPSFGRPRGLLRGERIKRYLREILPHDFEDLRIPFAAIASDLRAAERVTLDTGDLVEALRASFSIPYVLEPVDDGTRLLVDGGITEPLPVHAARDLGADVVIAINVTVVAEWVLVEGERTKPSDTMLRHLPSTRRTRLVQQAYDVMQYELAMNAARRADLVITPGVADFSQAAFLDGDELVRLGEQATRAAMPELRALLTAGEAEAG